MRFLLLYLLSTSLGAQSFFVVNKELNQRIAQSAHALLQQSEPNIIIYSSEDLSQWKILPCPQSMKGNSQKRQTCYTWETAGSDIYVAGPYLINCWVAVSESESLIYLNCKAEGKSITKSQEYWRFAGEGPLLEP